MNSLFGQPLSVLNVGLASFADAIAQRGGAATTVTWSPPANGDAKAGAALARLVNHPKVEAANSRAAERYLAAQPRIAARSSGISGSMATQACSCTSIISA